MAVQINTDECTACGACVDACPCEVLVVEDTCTVTDPDECTECGSCVDECPVEALSL